MPHFIIPQPFKILYSFENIRVLLNCAKKNSLCGAALNLGLLLYVKKP